MNPMMYKEKGTCQTGLNLKVALVSIWQPLKMDHGEIWLLRSRRSNQINLQTHDLIHTIGNLREVVIIVVLMVDMMILMVGMVILVKRRGATTRCCLWSWRSHLLLNGRRDTGFTFNPRNVDDIFAEFFEFRGIGGGGGSGDGSGMRGTRFSSNMFGDGRGGGFEHICSRVVMVVAVVRLVEDRISGKLRP
ncbi:hypothetical protein Tco_1065140 [Tanacetum coccineum]